MPYRLTTEFTFDAAHFIEGHRGKCGRMHGHTYTVRITAEAQTLAPSEYCDRPNMVADYSTLKWARNQLDHAVLNEVMGTGDTTAEMIAKWIYDNTKTRIGTNVRSFTVAVSETPGNWAEYSE